MKHLLRMSSGVLTVCLAISCNAPSSFPEEETASAAEVAAPSEVDVCRCLTEPGNSDYLKENGRACRDAISREIGVENWEAVNMSQNPEASARFDRLARRCTGDAASEERSEADTVAAAFDDPVAFDQITTSSGYVWESIDYEADIYTTLAFDGSDFRNTAYVMNGQTDSGKFKKMIELGGSWTMTGEREAIGVIAVNKVTVGWTFSEDFSSLVNNKGVRYDRVKVRD